MKSFIFATYLILAIIPTVFKAQAEGYVAQNACDNDSKCVGLKNEYENEADLVTKSEKREKYTACVKLCNMMARAQRWAVQNGGR
uniref:Uncharacterized protein n=1 Tax=Trichuris muris TaxID=70415 RepID=A0A5S6QHW4_TRIMR